jgi:hypothetical protein
VYLKLKKKKSTYTAFKLQDTPQNKEASPSHELVGFGYNNMLFSIREVEKNL